MPILDAAHTVLQQELARDPEQFRATRSQLVDLGLHEGTEARPLPVRTAGVLGALADAASTYYFMKNGGSESNALYKGLGGSPAKTALGVAGGYAAARGALELLKRISPKAAEAAEANLAASQIGFAANNMRNDRPEASFDAYLDSVDRHTRRR